jgi:aspartate kinase
VALAAALGADRCEIYTDVPGVFTADPRRVPGARVIPEISFDEMLELASAGAQVMHSRAIEIAARFGVDIRVVSSFEEGGPGTLITRSPHGMEGLVLTGIASQKGHARLVMRDLPVGIRTATAFVVALADAGVSVDMISEAAERDGRVQLQVTADEGQLDVAERVCAQVAEDLGGAGVEVVRGLTRVALVGSGMHRRPGVYARAFRALLDAGVEIFAVSTSGISITLLVRNEREDDTLQALHAAFELELDGTAAGG